MELTCLDGGINDEIGDGGGNGGGRGDGGDDDDFFCSQDERENVGPKQREPPGKMDAKRRDKNLNQPTTVESSQENAIIFDDDQVEPDSDVDSDDRPHGKMILVRGRAVNLNVRKCRPWSVSERGVLPQT